MWQFNPPSPSEVIAPTAMRIDWDDSFDLGIAEHRELVETFNQQDTLKNLRFDSGSRPPMAEPGKWAFGGNAPQRGINTR